MTATSLDLGSMLEVKMAYDSERQKVLASNIANVDTPGFKAKDLAPLDFRNVLSSQNAQIQLATTSDGHQMGNNAVHTQMFKNMVSHNTFDMLPDGSTVVVEEQMMKVTQNATDYQMTTSLYKKVGNLFKEALGLQPS